MEIRNKPTHDPIADVPIADAYFCWAVQAGEEIAGKPGLQNVLREAGLERLVDNYPPEDLLISGKYTIGEYSNYLSCLQTSLGRASRSLMQRVGRFSAKNGREQQGALYGAAALLAVKLLPPPAQIKLAMENIQGGFRKLYEPHNIHFDMAVEDRGDRIAYVIKQCPYCAGKLADEPMCVSWVGSLADIVEWITGKEFEIRETECLAMGAAACVWEVSKTPKM